MKRVLIFTYGVISYAIGMATFAYMAGFLAILLPQSRLILVLKVHWVKLYSSTLHCLPFSGSSIPSWRDLDSKESGLRLLVKPWKGALMSYS